MSEFSIFLAIISVLTLLVHLARRPLRHAPALMPLLGLLVGALTGPYVLAWLHPEGWADSGNTVLLWASRITLALMLSAFSLSLPLRLLRRQMKSLLWLLIPALFVRWLVISLIAYLVTNFTVWGAVLTGAALAPVDVVLLGGIARTGLAPRRLLRLASAEALLATALMLPLVLLSLLMLVPPAHGVWPEFLLQGLLRHWLAGVAFGAVAGYLVARFHLALRRHTDLSLTWLSVVLALALLSVSVLAQFAEIAAVVVGTLVYAWMTQSHREARRQHLVAVMAEFTVLPVFVLLGASLPVSGWAQLGWQGLGAAVGIVLLGRLLTMLALRPELRLVTFRETVVASWLGPIGVAALYFITRVQDMADIPSLWRLGSLVIVISTIFTALGLWLKPAPRRIASPEPVPEPEPEPLPESERLPEPEPTSTPGP